MIRFATPARRAWAFALTIVTDLVVLEAMRAATGNGSVVAPFGLWYLMHHVGLVCEGGTLGHRLVGLRLVRADGDRVSVVMAAVREFSFLGVAVPPLGLGLLWMLDQPQRRGWHDLIAGTVVVHEARVNEDAAPEWADAPPWQAQKHAKSQAQEGERPGGETGPSKSATSA